MSNVTKRAGFTLIELLIVVVIIGLLAAIAIPKFQDTRGRAQISALQSDLKNLTTMQEDYYVLNGKYAQDESDLSFSASSGVTIDILQGETGGWSAKATHAAGSCVVYYGQASPVSPATREGVIACE
ncbi:MAG: hypothetical protein RLZZ621_1475 [Gemmatimonadota bacterium]|jgi:type IV pilus assembly protein PilA